MIGRDTPHSAGLGARSTSIPELCRFRARGQSQCPRVSTIRQSMQYFLTGSMDPIQVYFDLISALGPLRRAHQTSRTVGVSAAGALITTQDAFCGVSIAHGASVGVNAPPSSTRRHQFHAPRHGVVLRAGLLIGIPGGWALRCPGVPLCGPGSGGLPMPGGSVAVLLL